MANKKEFLNGKPRGVRDEEPEETEESEDAEE